MTADRMRVSLDFFLLMDPERISNKINGKIGVCVKRNFRGGKFSRIDGFKIVPSRPRMIGNLSLSSFTFP